MQQIANGTRFTSAQRPAIIEYIRWARRLGAEDIRVDQSQVNASGQKVGINRPDLQYTLFGKRWYIEWDTAESPRGPGHGERILANDPDADILLFELSNER